MSDLQRASDICSELREDFNAIEMSRPYYVLDALVVKTHDHQAAQWCQAVLEMRIKHNTIRRSVIAKKIAEIERDKMRSTGDVIDELHAQEKDITIEEIDLSMLGALREFFALYDIYKTYPRFTREEIDAAQPELYRRRLQRQAEQDLLSTGTISVGNIEGLRQVGFSNDDVVAAIAAARRNNGLPPKQKRKK